MRVAAHGELLLQRAGALSAGQLRFANDMPLPDFADAFARGEVAAHVLAGRCCRYPGEQVDACC